jgi:serine/threonine protein kinase
VERRTGQVYARKQIRVGSDPEYRRMVEEKVRNECAVMRKLSHLHIISVSIYYPKPDSWNIIMDVVADYNLKVFLQISSSRDEYQNLSLMLLPWFGCLIDALNFAHRCKVIHNDIKPSNILIKGDTVYLADFGLSSDFASLDSSRYLANNRYGTPEYKAPETEHGGPPSRKADVFSLGCVFSEMLTVYCGRSLESFRRYCSSPEAAWVAFRYSLARVRAWLQQLRDTGDWQLGWFHYQIMDMIGEDPNRRSPAEDIRKNLLNGGLGDLLFCSMHL